MHRPYRYPLLLLCVLIIFIFSILLAGCSDKDDEFGSTIDIAKLTQTPVLHPMSGQIKGTSSALYDVWVKNTELKPVCTDDMNTDIQIKIAANGALPAKTHLTEPLPPTTQYFQMDIMAPLYQLNNGECDYVNPSDVMTHVVIEGSYQSFDETLVVLSCGLTGSVGSGTTISNFTQAGGVMKSGGRWVYYGTITCIQSEQITYKFSFDGLQLKEDS
jgi:hypothetical protein